MEVGYIYIHRNKINGKRYIGQTVVEPEKRWGSNGNRYKGCTLFYNAIQKYGWDNFEHSVRKTPLCLLDVIERNLIKFYNTSDRNYGYNLESGGNSNKKLSLETRSKISENHADLSGKNHPWYGKHLPQETREKISIKNKGHSVSEETRNKISISLKGRYVGDKCLSYGRHPSEETKRKISMSKKGWKLSEEHREKLHNSRRGGHNSAEHNLKISLANRGEPFYAIDRELLTIEEEFATGAEAIKWLKTTKGKEKASYAPIGKCLHSSKPYTAYGFRWVYKSKYMCK